MAKCARETVTITSDGCKWKGPAKLLILKVFWLDFIG
jgi:hypothetical protein